METRDLIITKLKEGLSSHHFALVQRLLELNVPDKIDFSNSDRLTELTRKAELNLLNKYKFDAPDWLEPLEAGEFMELENEEQIKFGNDPEWAKDFIKDTKLGKTSRKLNV